MFRYQVLNCGLREGIPKSQIQERVEMKALTLRLEDEDYEQLRALAFVERRSMTEIVRDAIRRYVEPRAERTDIRRILERAVREQVGGPA